MQDQDPCFGQYSQGDNHGRINHRTEEAGSRDLASAGLIDAVSNEESNGPEDEVITAREGVRPLVDAWGKF